ncbi:a4f1a270-10ac-4419-9b55-8945e28df65c [Thermothielavioides terrestris]|uniref:A4f1a270-10ac-4419-9b55-8945e28df65c n=1 Tax=Thermothielavioides terrestris TaxID=2587410 RepID=A0A446B568_9PEZI|nr:a4f1a270-10ac-4419-9b55-8945e28df65c [Thermothielavioides terrestris]
MDAVEVALVASPFANLAPLYEVDPDADALLIVPPVNQDFAPWREPHQPGEVNGVLKTSSTTAAAAPASRPGLRIKVSSKHLTLASRVFRNKLQFGSSRAARQSDGRIHLKLADGFDPKAVSIVMNAVHGRGSKVPKAVDLDTLAQIALFVDRFQLLDAVEVYAERWIAKLESSVPDADGRDLVLWIYASHVFRHAAIFHAVTKSAAARSAGPIPTLGLPIREKIIQTIDANRQTLLTRALSLVHSTVDDLLTTTPTPTATTATSSSAGVAPCPTHHCDALLLGELTRSLHRHGLLWPRPARPFAGLSFAAVVDGARGGAALAEQRRLRLQQQTRQEGGRLAGHYQKGAKGGVVEEEVEVEPWHRNGNGYGNVNGHAVNEQEGVKKTSGWGAVGGGLPVTPVASPEPVYRSARGVFEQVHECDATRVVARLDELGKLADEVDGLVLESSLGYQRY